MFGQKDNQPYREFDRYRLDRKIYRQMDSWIDIHSQIDIITKDRKIRQKNSRLLDNWISRQLEREIYTDMNIKIDRQI